MGSGPVSGLIILLLQNIVLWGHLTEDSQRCTARTCSYLVSFKHSPSSQALFEGMTVSALLVLGPPFSYPTTGYWVKTPPWLVCLTNLLPQSCPQITNKSLSVTQLKFCSSSMDGLWAVTPFCQVLSMWLSLACELPKEKLPMGI